jgi:hypothetical protein
MKTYFSLALGVWMQFAGCASFKAGDGLCFHPLELGAIGHPERGFSLLARDTLVQGVQLGALDVHIEFTSILVSRNPRRALIQGIVKFQTSERAPSAEVFLAHGQKLKDGSLVLSRRAEATTTWLGEFTIIGDVSEDSLLLVQAIGSSVSVYRIGKVLEVREGQE